MDCMTEEQAMSVALALARDAQAAGEVPIGAVVLYQGKVVGTGQNRVIRDADTTAHAEIVALRAANAALQNYRLPGCTVVSTLEPCAMCAGALMHARVARLVYAARDPKAGADGSVLQVINFTGANHAIEVSHGECAAESSELLRSFFAERRRRAATPNPA